MGQLCGDHAGAVLLQVPASVRVVQLLDAEQEAAARVPGSGAPGSAGTGHGHEWKPDFPGNAEDQGQGCAIQEFKERRVLAAPTSRNIHDR